MGLLEEALSDHEGQVDSLLKQCSKLTAALKGWKRACSDGAINDRQKHADQASSIALQFGPAIQGVARQWTFDSREYLSSDVWQNELIEVAAKHSSLRVFLEGGELVSSPVVLRPDPSRACLRLGKVRWSKLRPRRIVDELVKLKDRGERQNVQEFLDALYASVEYLNRNKPQLGSTVYAKLRDVYDLFSLTPGWKKENSEAAFAQYLYALDRSETRMTRSGKMYDLERAAGQPKARDLFAVVAEDGRTIRYYGIHFR